MSSLIRAMGPLARRSVLQNRGIVTSARRMGVYDGNVGYPFVWLTLNDKGIHWDPFFARDYDVMTRDEWGVPASIPPELSTQIKHTYHVPPQYYPFLKKLGDDDPALKPYMDRLINGEMTFDDYEEMFYKFAVPFKITRSRIPMPYRSPQEMANEEEVAWESAWLAFRQRILGDYTSQHYFRDMIGGLAFGFYVAYLWIDTQYQYRIDMKLFYLEAPEHKINWIVPRGDL